MSEDLLSRMTMREATHGDYQAVMNMASPDTFRDGFDYLPAKFHGFVDDPDTVFLLVEVDGEVVFLHVVCSQDGGEIIFGKTIRLARKIQGKRLSRKIVAKTNFQVMAKIMEKTGRPPKLSHDMRGLERRDLDHIYSELPMGMKSVINIMYFRSDVTPMKGRLMTDAQMSLPALVSYQPNDIHRLLPPAFSAAVLNEGIVFVDWDPHKLSKSNMKKFVEAGCYILVDSVEPAARSLSFGGSYMTPRGRVYNIDVHVHCKDEGLCKAHIINHVKNACSQYTDTITFCVMVTDKGLKDVVMAFCVQYLQFSHLPHDHDYAYYILDWEAYFNPKVTKPVRTKSKY